MLRSAFDQIASPANLSPRRRCTASAKAEQCLKRGRRLSPTIVSEHEFVEVHLELPLADTVIRADQPLLQVADCPVRERDDRHRAAAELHPGRLVPRHVPNTGRGQPIEALVRIGIDGRARRDLVFHKRMDGGHLHVREDNHPESARGWAAFFNGHLGAPAVVRPLDSGVLTVYAVGSSMVHTPAEALSALWSAARLDLNQDGRPDLFHPRFGFADAFSLDISNASIVANPGDPNILRRSGAWLNPTGCAIDHGPMLLMIDNYLSGNFLPKLFMSHPRIQDALATVFPSRQLIR
jgi:Putative glucoamylase